MSFGLSVGLARPSMSMQRSKAESSASSFRYITYIRASPDQVWRALLDQNVQRRCWPGLFFVTDWQAGHSWRMVYPDGRTANSGVILEIDPVRRLVLTWRNDFHPERTVEGYSEAVLELSAVGGATKICVLHSMDRPNSKLIAVAAESWPLILANLKSLMETGEVAVR